MHGWRLHVPPCSTPHSYVTATTAPAIHFAVQTANASAETIKLLVEAGADPLLSSGWHPSPLEMTANQGNAE